MSPEQLKKVIMFMAQNQSTAAREDFLSYLCPDAEKKIIISGNKRLNTITPKELFESIQEFERHIKNGDFFDEDAHYEALEREDHWYRDVDERDINFSDAEQVEIAEELLEYAKWFFRKGDIKTAYKAYSELFDIFEDSSYYEYEEEIFAYTFSFDTAMDKELYREHKTIYLRCLYLDLIQKNKPESLYSLLSSQNEILLGEISGIDTGLLPGIQEFLPGYIKYLEKDPKKDRLLTDALIMKGGLDEIRHFVQSKGKDHPGIYIYYYTSLKEKQAPRQELKKILIRGINMIPVKYQTRAVLGQELGELSKQDKDEKNLLLGYSACFYSRPNLQNMILFLDYIISENESDAIKKIRSYLKRFNLRKMDDAFFDFESDDIYSLSRLRITKNEIVIGRFILEGLDPFEGLLSPKNYLGFNGGLRYIAIVLAFTLKCTIGKENAVNINSLLDHYCYEGSKVHPILLKMVNKKAGECEFTDDKRKELLSKVKAITRKRLQFILTNKKRGGYESGCLLSVACAEAGQIINHSGNEFILNIDTQYKRFSAFRGYLKHMAERSRHLLAIT